MSDAKKEKILFAAVEESTPGTIESITANDFIGLTEDGATMNSPREKAVTNPLSGDRLRQESRKLTQNGDGQVTTYLRAGENAGDEPEIDLFLRSFGFSKEQVATKTTTTTGHSGTTLNITAGDEAKYKVGQHILIDDRHVTQIAALASGVITLEVAPSTDFADSVEIEKLCAYRCDDGSDVFFTAYKLFNQTVQQHIPYCKPKAIEFTDINTNAVPKCSVSFDGIDFVEQDLGSSLGLTPNFIDTEKPFGLGACLYKDGVAVDASEFNIKFEQGVAKKKVLCNENGNASTRATGKIQITGGFTTYKKDDEAGDLPSDSTYSLSIALYVPSTTEGDKEHLVCFHIPRIKIDEVNSNSDVDGLVISEHTFMAEPTSDSSTYPVITFI